MIICYLFVRKPVVGNENQVFSTPISAVVHISAQPLDRSYSSRSFLSLVVMSQGNLLALAQQGNVQAIASLINRSLQPKGITAKVALKEGCLQVMLESTQLPNEQVLVEFVRKGITGLDVASIQKVKLYGRLTGEEFPVWTQEFEVGKQQSPIASSMSDQSVASSSGMIQQKQPSLKERAKQGDVDAITQLLNIALQHKNITVKASLKEDCLQVMLQSSVIPDQTSATLIRREIIMLKIEVIKNVKIYAQQIDNDFPDWTQEFELSDLKNSPKSTSKSNTQNLTISFNENLVSINGIESAFPEKILAIVGSIILFTGVFTPIISLPLIGSLNYFHNGKGDGVILLILAVISFLLALKDKYQELWWTGIGSLGVLIIGFINFQMRIAQATSHIEELSGNQFRGLADAAVQSVQLQWGWILLILGTGMIVAAAAISEKQNISHMGYRRYFSDLLNIKRSKKSYIFLGLVLISIFLPKIYMEVNSKREYNNQRAKARQSEAKTYIGSINRGQQAFYLENNKFASTIEDLMVGISAETSNYKYSIVSADESQAVATATAKEGELKSYLGAVLVAKSTEYETTTTICESNKPTTAQPETPQIIGKEIQCPSDYSKLER